MSYTSFVFFIAYFGITYLLYSVFPQKAKWCVLLVGSWVFYTVATKGHVAAIIASSILVWAVGLLIQKLNDTFKEKRKLAEKSERKKAFPEEGFFLSQDRQLSFITVVYCQTDR